MKRTALLARMAALIALGVVASYMSAIPLMGAKLFPAQAAINVVAGVIIGPWYAGVVALCIALIRIALGTGSLLALPGSIFGALLAGLLYKATRSTIAAMVGEVVGTGLIAGIVAWPMAVYLMHKAATMGMFVYVISFSTSSVAGAILGGAILAVMSKSGQLGPAAE